MLAILHEAVAPLAGAWIETGEKTEAPESDAVAPLAGAWIETADGNKVLASASSHPSRVRGLKFNSVDCMRVQTSLSDSLHT